MKESELSFEENNNTTFAYLPSTFKLQASTNI